MSFQQAVTPERTIWIFSEMQENSGAFAYVSMSDVRSGGRVWYNRVLYRTMRHEKDWTGGFNNFCAWGELAEALARLYR